MTRQLVIIVAVAASLAGLAAGCSTAPTPSTLATQQHQQGLVAGHALTVGRGPDHTTQVTQIRLGIMPATADATGLVAVQLGYYDTELGGAAEIQPVTYTSGQAEAGALTSGKLDAAYIGPIAAVSAWQTSGGNIRIISGAAASHSGTGQQATAVLVVTTSFLTTHRTDVEKLLQAQVRADLLLNTDVVQAASATENELTTMLGHTPRARHIATALARTTYTCNPLPPSILTQARHAAAAGQLSKVSSLIGLYDLGPVNQLLRTSGMAEVPS